MRLTEVSCSNAIRRSKYGCTLVCCNIEDKSWPPVKNSATDVSIWDLVGPQGHVDKPQSVFVNGIVDMELLNVVETSVVLVSALPEGPPTAISKAKRQKQEQAGLPKYLRLG